jgi:hypothetical protein
MLSKLVFVAGVVLPAALCAPAAAGEVGAAGSGVLADMVAWAKPLSDHEMAELRGGFAGFAFNVIMTGTIDNLDSSSGVTSAPPPNVTTSNGMVNVQTAIGSFNGASGVFQIANLENSSFNVVNQNLFVQVAIIDVANTASIPTIQNLLNGTFAH